MIDSQETTPLQQGTAESLANTVDKHYLSKKEVVERITEIAKSDEVPNKVEIDNLKSIFYKLHTAERDEQLKTYLAEGGDPETYKIQPDVDEENFKAQFAIIKEKRQKAFIEQEELKQENLKKKEEIIEKIKNMATTPEEASKRFQEFKTLQQEWKAIKLVPVANINELWRNYQLYTEQFYDLLSLNREAREYDFKKNLEKKIQLCEAAEKLDAEPDVVSAFHQLQELHQEFRETGPVEKDLREQIWTRFKAASTVINKKHQNHFEELRAKEEDNLARKNALCEKVEELITETCKTVKEWEKITQEIINIQKEWKTIGFAPQKMNVKIFERFRKACDTFFNNKSEFFKDLKAKYSQNEEKKRALLQKAKELKDSTDWKETTDKFIALQKEWRTIGMVPKKIGDVLWNDFVETCNYFFEQRNKEKGNIYAVERENLKKKQGIIDKLKDLTTNPVDAMEEEVDKLVELYNSIGHVPFKSKDTIYENYHKALNALYDILNIDASKKRIDKFKDSIKDVAARGEKALIQERSHLMHRLEQLRQEVNTYENNLGFLNIKSKKGNTLIDEMNRKVQHLRDNIEETKQKIKAIDVEIKSK